MVPRCGIGLRDTEMKYIKPLAVPIILMGLSAFMGWLISWGAIRSEALSLADRVKNTERRIEHSEMRQNTQEVSIAEIKRDVSYIREGIDDLRRRR